MASPGRLAPRAAGALLALGLLAGLAGDGLGAHGFLQRAEPREGSTVSTPPAQIKLWFGEKLEAAYSTVRVLDAAGRRVDRGDARLDPANRKLLTVSVPPLSAGTYTVMWRVLSVDTHVTQGRFTFRIAP
jgi:methionine-rich copper-binding protein CopC